MTPFLRKIFHEQRIAQDFGSVLSFAGPVIGGLIGQDAASSAGDAQLQASQQGTQATLQAQREANQLQKYMYDRSRADNLPFLNNGTAASNRLSYLLGLPVSGASGANGGASGSYTPLTTNDLADTSNGDWRPNASLYASSPQYRAAWDDFINWHSNRYGVNPNNARGTNVADLAGELANGGFDLNAYNSEQQAQIAQKNAQAQDAANADSNYGSLMRKFTTADLQNDVPYQQGFQYALDQGQLGVNRLAAASGSLNSGATLKALQDRAANVANQYAGDAYNRFTNDQTNQYNRLAGLAGAGQTAANSLSSAGANYANAGTSTALSTGNALSNLYTGAGNSRAASSIAGGNSLSGGLNSISNYYQTQNLLSQLGGLKNTGTPTIYGNNDLNQSLSGFNFTGFK